VRRHHRAAALLAAAGLGTALLASCSHPGHAAAPATTPTTGTPVADERTVPAPTTTRPRAAADWTLVATTHGAIPRYSHPGGPTDGTVPGSWHGAPSTLPVIGSRPGWLDVRLAQRPNESTAWVHAKDVTLASTPYRIVVDLATTHLLLYRAGRLVASVPAGIGTAEYPTPTGNYFLAFLAAPPSPGYGAFVMVTSAHSNAITDWEDSGDAIVAIHGPLGSDSEIGTTGAAVSHGCVRLHEPDLLMLRDVPDGSPIDIVAA
jgi:lipoprotein-anchoring transpeptidase ErfK/SrfK